jgi:hypothetical protein
MNPILLEQQKRNADVREAWQRFRPHRERVTRLLVEPMPSPDETLCVLGAGNCNDVDLTQLTQAFAEVHLVDLDEVALEFGVSHQDASSQSLRVHAGLDVTGVVAELAAACRAGALDEAASRALIDRAAGAPLPPLGGPFDVVASVGLLTQLIDSIRLAVGEAHPRFVDLLLAVRNRHLGMLVELTRPGGRLVLVTDVVSSATFPDLPQIPEAQLRDTVLRLIQARNFFTGANPFVLWRLLQSEPELTRHTSSVQLLGPWLWDLGPRYYAVFAICAQRAS